MCMCVCVFAVYELCASCIGKQIIPAGFKYTPDPDWQALSAL